MKRPSSFILATALAGICILIAVGCSTNPVSSEIVIASDPPQQDTAVENETAEEISGGYPAIPATTIEKFESEDEGALYMGVTP
jgi:hypothetical protein